jgi:hypothetical protein
MISPTFEMLNQRGTPMFFSDTLANRPPAAIVGRIFVSIDTFELYRDTGTTWDLLSGPGTGTITGSGTAFKYPVFTASGVIGNGTIEQFTTENISTRNFSIDTSANAIPDEAKLDLTILSGSQVESALLEFSQGGEGPPILQITNTLDATYLGIGNSELYLSNANQIIAFEQNAATGLTINNATSGITANTFIKLQTLNSTTYGEIAKLSALYTNYKITVGNDLVIYNGSASGDIAILNDFATGSIKFAAGGSSTAHLTIASTGATTFSRSMAITFNQNAQTLFNLTNSTSGVNSIASIRATSSNGYFEFSKNSATTTAYKIFAANDSYLYNVTSGDIAILNDFSTGNIKFAAGGSTTAQMTLTSTGRLGIGITAPTTDLDITKSVGSGGAVTGLVKNSNSTGEAAFTIRNDSFYAAFEFFGSAFPTPALINQALFSVQSGASYLAFATLGNFPIGFRTNSSGTSNERLTIFSGGNVSIGSLTDTGEKLQVTGTSKITGASSFGGNIILEFNQNASTSFRIRNTTSGTGAASEIVLQNDVSSGSASISKTSTTTTAYKILLAKDLQIYNGSIGGDIAFLNDFASGNIKFATGGSSTAQMTLTTNGSLGLGSTSANASAILQLDSTTRGFLPPRMTSVERNAIGTLVAGLMVYDTTLNKLYVYTNAWEQITSI